MTATEQEELIVNGAAGASDQGLAETGRIFLAVDSGGSGSREAEYKLDIEEFNSIERLSKI